MEFIHIDGDPKPKVMYTPYIYSEITDCSFYYVIKDPKGYKIKYKDKKEVGNLRDPDRIEPFMKEVGRIWKENVPDWRFGQFIENVFTQMEYNYWMLEEPRMLEEIENVFKKGGSGRKLQQKKKTRKKGFNKE